MVGLEIAIDTGPFICLSCSCACNYQLPECMGLSGNNFKHIMKDLLGAIIIGSAFQAFLGRIGLMLILVRFMTQLLCPLQLWLLGYLSTAMVSHGLTRVLRSACCKYY